MKNQFGCQIKILKGHITFIVGLPDISEETRNQVSFVLQMNMLELILILSFHILRNF